MSKEVSPFTHLHTHTEYSNFDGCGKLGDFLRKAKEQGSEAIAFTEHGSVRQLTKLQEEADEVGIRPIYGVELYLCDDMDRKGLTPDEKAEAIKGVPAGERREAMYQAEVRLGIRDRYHLTVLAKDAIGLKNLMRITSLGWIKGFYKRPRVDINTICENHEGLIVLSGCQSGSIGWDFLHNDPAAALDKVERLHATFGEDFYGEIMPHNMSEQAEVNRAVMQVASMFDMPLVSTQDAHYIEPDDWKYQEAMLCINTRKTLSDPDRFKFSTTDFWLKGRRDLEDTYQSWHSYISKEDVKRSLDNTMVIAEKCQAKIEVDRFKAIIPTVEVPAEYNGDEVAYMRALCLEGWHERGLEKIIRDEAARRGISLKESKRLYLARMEREFQAIEKQKVVRYFLVVWDLYKWVRRNKIEVGPGRGSVGGSLVAFLLGITDIDPIRFSLLFERFLAPSRIDMPDIDMDFEDERRGEIITRLRERYGDDCTAQIATNNKLTGKQCLKDIARIMDIPLHEVQPVVDSILQRSSGDERASMTIEDSFTENPICQKFAIKYPGVLDYAKKLEGQVKSLGMHAAGVVVAPEPLINLVPLELRQEKSANPIITTAVDMYGVANLGLMKLDVLGIRNLTSMKRCKQAIKERHGVEIEWLDIPLNDKPTLDNFTKHAFTGIFQFDTLSADKICEGVEFTSFEDVAAMIALDRPGTARSGLATEYLKRKKDPKAIVSIHPIVDAICADTLGVIVYQEHVQRMFTDVAGFSPATADSLRRKIAKKYGDEAIAKERVAFVEGAVKNGLTQQLAEKLISQITFFGSYGFNKSHSVAYGMIGYRQMWLKTHYEIEYMWSLMATEPDSKEIIKLVRVARKMGIEVLPPDINASDPGDWSLNGNSIRGALGKIKGVGQAAVAAITAARPFTDFVDFCARIDRRRCHKGVVDAMLRAGALNSMVPNPKWLSENLVEVWGLVAKPNKKDPDAWKSKVQAFLDLSAEKPQWTQEEADAAAALVNPLASGLDPLEPHIPLIEGMRDNWLSLDSDNIWNPKSPSTAWIWGRVIEVKYNAVGDFHNGAPPSDEDKAKMGWGRRYANLNIEDRSGRNQRVKVDVDIFDTFRHIIDKAAQDDTTVIAAHVSINKQYHSMRSSFIVDLDELAGKIRDEGELTNLESCLWMGWAPGGGPNKARLDGDILSVTAMVAKAFTKFDKKGNEMAFITLLCADAQTRDVVCFGSSWPSFKAKMRQGVAAKFKLVKDKRSFILDDEVQGAMVIV